MRVLVAEDDAIARRVLTALLSLWGYDVVVVNEGQAAWDVLSQADPPRIALLDWEMPGLDGIEICRRIRVHRSEPYTYLLLLTGRRARADMLDGLAAGADDYVAKPFDEAELKARMSVGLRIATLQADLIAARETMREFALHDALTGSLNRAGVLDALEIELARLRRQGIPLAAAMIDLDHFKRINDTWGHAVGDDILRDVVRRMGAALRPYDRIGRLGGEEFLVLLPGCEPDGARQAAERIRVEVSRTPFLVGDASIDVTCSVGVACADAASTQSDLVQKADAALFRSKAAGRNMVT